jgi:hypothetical protein
MRFAGLEIAEVLNTALSTVSRILTKIGMGTLGWLGLEPAARYARRAVRPGIAPTLNDSRVRQQPNRRRTSCVARHALPSQVGVEAWRARGLAPPSLGEARARRRPPDTPAPDEPEESDASVASRPLRPRAAGGDHPRLHTPGPRPRRARVDATSRRALPKRSSGARQMPTAAALLRVVPCERLPLRRVRCRYRRRSRSVAQPRSRCFSECRDRRRSSRRAPESWSRRG